MTTTPHPGGRPKRDKATAGEISVYPVERRGRRVVKFQASVRVRRADGSTTQIRRTRGSRQDAHDAVAAVAERERKRTAATTTRSRSAGALPEVVSVSDRSTVPELCTAYVRWLDGERAPATVRQYKGTVRRYITPVMADLTVGETTTVVLESLGEQMDPAAWRSSRAVLGGAWKWALRRGEITTASPVTGTRTAPRTRPVVTTVTAAELRALVERVKVYRDAPDVMGPKGPRVAWLPHLLLVNLAAGTRISELVKMQWSDIDGLDADDQPVVLTVHGTHVRHQRTTGGGDQDSGTTRTRRVTLPAFAVDALRAWRDELGEAAGTSPWVWPTASGTPLQRDAVHRALRKVYDYQPKAGDPLPDLPGLVVTPHVLRHTAGTWVGHDGNRELAERFLGHQGQTVYQVHYEGEEVIDSGAIIQARWEAETKA